MEPIIKRVQCIDTDSTCDLTYGKIYDVIAEESLRYMLAKDDRNTVAMCYYKQRFQEVADDIVVLYKDDLLKTYEHASLETKQVLKSLFPGELKTKKKVWINVWMHKYQGCMHVFSSYTEADYKNDIPSDKAWILLETMIREYDV